MTTETGGSAFPTPDVYHPNGQVEFGTPGMTLLDWFAAHASDEDVESFMPHTIGEHREFKEKHGFPPSRQWARYQHADAMLKARDRK